MVEIITSDGISLDLDPGAVFDIELDNPLFESDSIFCPWSTSIGLLPSSRNCRVLGFMPELMVEPALQTVNVQILVDAVVIFTGKLIYESYEDGILYYTFTAKTIDGNFEEDDISDNGVFAGPIQIYKTGSAGRASYSDEFSRIRRNEDTILKSPAIIINGAEMSGITMSNQILRYANHPALFSSTFIPAVQMRSLLDDFFSGSLAVHDAISNHLDVIFMLCQYKPEAAASSIGFDSKIYINDTMPKISKADFIRGLADIFCAAYYQDGSIFRLIPFFVIAESAATLDWAERISDDFSLATDGKCGYTVTYDDDSSDNSYNGDDNGDEETVIEKATSYFDVAVNRTAPEEGEYKAVVHVPTGDIYSYTKKHIQGSIDIYPTEIVSRKTGNIEIKVVGADSDEEKSIPFKLVRSVPELIVTQSKSRFLVCPSVSLPSRGSERGSDIYVGVISNSQMTDKGITAVKSGGASGIETYKDDDSGFSITPSGLYKYHMDLRRWLSEPRQTVKASVNLRVQDIASFRFYEKVYFHGREWIVKKLSITVDVSSGGLECSAEFVSF